MCTEHENIPTFSSVTEFSKKQNFNFTFHNILIYNRATFNNRVACCIDFIREC